jgi:hypothetical protein
MLPPFDRLLLYFIFLVCFDLNLDTAHQRVGLITSISQQFMDADLNQRPEKAWHDWRRRYAYNHPPKAEA